jgi:hypothetical protein
LTLRRGAFHFLFFSVMFLATVMAAIGIDYAFWLVYVGRLENVQKPKTDEFEALPNVSPGTLRRLGQILTGKKSSFINFDRRKAPGVIRIGAFGDSFTYGDEVDAESDYPAQLQRRLKELGISNVEVLNFGSSWYGFGQVHIMWNEVGRDFDLDYALFGPQTLHPDRDTRFNHTEGSSPYYLHARYILDADGLRLIDIPGNTYSERFGNYYSLMPDTSLLRYDRSDPAFLAALLPIGRHIGNPFYYDERSELAEAVDIQKRLFQDIKKSGMSVLTAVYSGDDPVRWAANDLISGNFCITGLDRETDFPYIAPWGHNTPTGNALLALQYLVALLKRPIDARILQTEDIDRKATLPSVRGSLSSFDGIHIKLGGIDAGTFGPTYPLYSEQKVPSFLRDDQVNSLIALKAPEYSVLDGIFLAFRSDIAPVAPVRIVMQTSKGAQSANLKNLRSLADGINLGQADVPGLEVRSTYYRDQRVVINVSDLVEEFEDIPPNAKLQVFIGNRVVLEGARPGETGAFMLRPVNAELLIPRGTSSNDLAADRGVEEGSVDFVLQRGVERYSIPIAQWWIEHRRLQPPAECSGLPLLVGNSKSLAQ